MSEGKPEDGGFFCFGDFMLQMEFCMDWHLGKNISLPEQLSFLVSSVKLLKFGAWCLYRRPIIYVQFRFFVFVPFGSVFLPKLMVIC